MPAAARVDPKAYFSPAEWATLARRPRWKGLALLAHAWGRPLYTPDAAAQPSRLSLLGRLGCCRKLN